MKISISICPTNMECDGDILDEAALLSRIREVVEAKYPDATIQCLQVGYRQGDEWCQIDGRKSDALRSVVYEDVDWSDEELYETD